MSGGPLLRSDGTFPIVAGTELHFGAKFFPDTMHFRDGNTLWTTDGSWESTHIAASHVEGATPWSPPETYFVPFADRGGKVTYAVEYTPFAELDRWVMSLYSLPY